MREQKINISEGPPITSTTPEQLERQGAADGAAAKAHGFKALECAAVAAKRLRDELGLIGRLIEMRYFKTIGEANQKVVDASNALAPLAVAVAEAEGELAKVRSDHRGFRQRIVELFDRPLALTDTETSEPADGSGAASSEGGDPTSEGESPAEAEENSALRYGWRRDLSPWVVWLLLAVIAGAEFALSARAFQSIREQEWLVLLLAGLVGTGMVALAHRIGDNLAHLLEQPIGAKGRSPAKLVEVCFEIPALFIGIVGVATLRSSYFRLVHIAIPTHGLVCLQLMLAAAAVGVTMAGHNEGADELRDRRRLREQLTYARHRALKPHLAAQHTLVSAEGALRQALQGLVSDYGVQVHDVRRRFKDQYVRAFNEAAELQLGEAALPEVDPPSLVAQAAAWLDAHPVGTLAHLDFAYSSAAGVQEEGDNASKVEERPDPQGVFDLFDDGEEEAA